MADTDTQAFRLLDLPGEIRNKIYQAILCSFDPAPLRPSCRRKQTHLCTVTHSVEATILRTCRQVHREAYDVMVKTNQFVKITTNMLSMSELLLQSQIPILTLDREHTNQFQGYMMSLTIAPIILHEVDGPLLPNDQRPHDSPTETGPHFNFMILGRDWEAICFMLELGDASAADFVSGVRLSLDFNMGAAEVNSLPNYKIHISPLFLKPHQEAFLTRFYTQVSWWPSISITGTIEGDLAQRVKNQFPSPPTTDPHEFLEYLRAKQASGAALEKAQDFPAATAQWYAVDIQMRRVYMSNSWSSVVEKGGPAFTTAFEQIHFTIWLGLAQLRIVSMQDPNSSSADIFALGDEVLQTWYKHERMSERLKSQGSSFVPSTALRARCFSLQATCFRMIGQFGEEPVFVPQARYMAQCSIQEAFRLAPGDQDVENEMRLITAWVEEGQSGVSVGGGL